MPHLSELHGAATHLAVVAIPVYAILLAARRLGRGGAAVMQAEPWALACALVGVVAAGITGLLVRGQSQTELRGSQINVGTWHFWLGIVVSVVVLATAVDHLRRRQADTGHTHRASTVWTAIAVLAVAGVVVQGYLGGRMTYQHGVGIQDAGVFAQSARGASQLHLDLARGMSPVQAGKRAFSEEGLGCAACHGDLAQGERGPRLAGGRDLEDFRHVHGHGLFPASIVTDGDFAAIDAYLRTLG